jgi:enterochelin esterase-like enzyme
MNRRHAIKSAVSAAVAVATRSVDVAAQAPAAPGQAPGTTPQLPPLEGKRTQHPYISKKYSPGAAFDYTVYLSKFYTPSTPAALIVQFDAFNVQQAAAMEKLVADGQAPPFVVIDVPAGRLEPTVAGGTRRGLRVENYDHVGPEFPNLLVEEIIPEAIRVENLSISTNPDLHMTSGGSSGGTCAFNACWYRNDYFRRTYLSSPSFHSLGGADEFLVYAQRCEPRPVKVYMTFDEFESVVFSGNNYEAGLSAVRFLSESGYDFMWDYFPGKGHTWGNNDYEVQLKALRFIWKDWNTRAVAVLDYSKEVTAVVDKGAPWQPADSSSMPPRVRASVEAGTYEARGGEIWFTPKSGRSRKVAGDFHDISALTVSSDQWRLYVGDRRQRYVLSMTIATDGSLKDLRRVNVLLLATGSSTGARDMALDTRDHLYIATDAGVQVATPGTYVLVILPLPGDLPVDRVAFHGETLYASSGARVFKRALKARGRAAGDPVSPPSAALDLKFVTHPFLTGTNRQP